MERSLTSFSTATYPCAYGVSSVRFKAGLKARNDPDEVAALYRMANCTRYVWVVEAVDRAMRNWTASGIGELILDATAHHLVAVDDQGPILALHVAGNAVTRSIDYRGFVESTPLHLAALRGQQCRGAGLASELGHRDVILA